MIVMSGGTIFFVTGPELRNGDNTLRNPFCYRSGVNVMNNVRWNPYVTGPELNNNKVYSAGTFCYRSRVK